MSIEEIMKFVDIILNPYIIKILIFFTILSIIYYFTLIYKINKMEFNIHNIFSPNIRVWNSLKYSFKNIDLFYFLCVIFYILITLLLFLWLPLIIYFQPYQALKTISLIVLIFIIIILIINKIRTKSKKVINDIFFTDQPEINLSSAKKRIAKTIIDIINKHNSIEYLSIALNGHWGSGKSTILEEVKRKLGCNYEIMWINFWKIETPEDTILELKKQFIYFIKKQFIFIPFPISLIIYNFFKIISGKGNNISEILQIFKSQDTKNLFDSENEFQKFLNCAFEYSKREKIVIIFDDIDRVLNREDIFFFLKTICYVVGHKNIISITGIDIDQTSSLISNYSDKLMNSVDENQSDNNTIQTNTFDYNDFIYKIFNTIIDTYNNQDDIFQFAQNEFISKSDNRLSNILESHGFDPNDKQYISKDISEFMTYTNINNLFVNYRELKSSVNDFFSKLLHIKAERKGIYFEHLIKPSDIFLLCCLRNIDSSIYSKLENMVKLQVTKYLNEEDTLIDKTNIDFHTIILNFIKENLVFKQGEIYHAKNKKSRRPIRIFELIYGQKFTDVDDKAFTGTEFLIFDNNKNSVITSSALRFYFYPYIEIFDFSTKEILDHLSQLREKENTNEFSNIIEDFVFKVFSNVYSNPDTFAWTERINNYLFRMKYILRNMEQEDTVERLTIINRIFICISKYLKDELKLGAGTFDTISNLMGLFNDDILFRELWGNNNNRINVFKKYKDLINEFLFTNELLDTLIAFSTNTRYQQKIINAIKIPRNNIIDFILSIYGDKKEVGYKLKKEFRNYINSKINRKNLKSYDIVQFSIFIIKFYTMPKHEYKHLDKKFIIRIASIYKIIFMKIKSEFNWKSDDQISELIAIINQMNIRIKKILKIDVEKKIKNSNDLKLIIKNIKVK